MSDCRDNDNNCTQGNDPEDGLPVQCVNEWAKHKHNYIKRYLEATHGVRGKFIRDSGAAYVDLFSGPGKARVASTGEIIDGSPRLAVNIDRQPFTDIVLCEYSKVNIAALETRFAGQRRVTVVPGDCNEEITNIIQKQRIPINGYNVALIDPFHVGNLAFSTIAQLANFRRMDLVINFPIVDVRRNWDKVDRIERFVGLSVDSWGFEVSPKMAPKILALFQEQLTRLGYREQQTRAPQITNEGNTALYHLVFASKHELGSQIWQSISSIEPSGQRRLPGM